ncbi:MAG: quinate 5-dehydrogenase [Fimbriimonadaceae bacterium]
MKTVVSVSLGTSQRDKQQTVEFLGDTFSIERRGTDGDMARFAETFKELDGKVDALGVGGADIYLRLPGRVYAFREIKNIVDAVKNTPVVDGGGLKHTLERETIRQLQREKVLDFAKLKVLMVSAVDRFGMAQALEEALAQVTYGDLMFGLGVPIPLRKYKSVITFGKLMLPIVTQLPFKWFYPTGKQQEERKPKYSAEFLRADVIAGDWHYIRRYMPDKLPGRTIITQTIRKADLDFLKSAEVARVITTTPEMGGETFATNVMEGVIVAHLGKKAAELTEKEYLDTLALLDWKPNVIELA